MPADFCACKKLVRRGCRRRCKEKAASSSILSLQSKQSSFHISIRRDCFSSKEILPQIIYFLVGVCPEWPSWSSSAFSTCAYPTRELSDWFSGHWSWTTTRDEEDVSHEGAGDGSWWQCCVTHEEGSSFHIWQRFLVVEGCLQ